MTLVTASLIGKNGIPPPRHGWLAILPVLVALALHGDAEALDVEEEDERPHSSCRSAAWRELRKGGREEKLGRTVESNRTPV